MLDLCVTDNRSLNKHSFIKQWWLIIHTDYEKHIEIIECLCKVCKTFIIRIKRLASSSELSELDLEMELEPVQLVALGSKLVDSGLVCSALVDT